VTAHPAPENARHWWLACGKWRRLHAITGQALTAEQLRAAIDECRLVRALWRTTITRTLEHPGH
jgi:hypothetical protein